MKDYADSILRLKIGEKNLHNLLLKRRMDQDTLNTIDECIVALIEIKQWVKENQNADNEQV